MDATTQELLKKRKRKEKRAELFPMHIRIIKKLEIFLTFLKDNKNFERKKSKRKHRKKYYINKYCEIFKNRSFQYRKRTKNHNIRRR